MTTETLGVSTKSTAEAVTSPNMEVAEDVLLEGSFLIGLGRREVGGKVGKFFVVKKICKLAPVVITQQLF